MLTIIKKISQLYYKTGTNILLVAVYEGEGWWSGFFGFDVGAEFTVNLPGPS